MNTAEAVKRAAAQRREIAQGGLASDNLTLRDYFAAKAMTALISKHPALIERGSQSHQVCGIATGAYDYADAMLKVRKK